MADSKPEKKPADAAPATRRVLPMDLQLGDRIVDETGEYEVVGRPYTTAAGKNAHVRVRRVDNAEVEMIRSYSAHERISVKRTITEEGSQGWRKRAGAAVDLVAESTPSVDQATARVRSDFSSLIAPARFHLA